MIEFDYNFLKYHFEVELMNEWMNEMIKLTDRKFNCCQRFDERF